MFTNNNNHSSCIKFVKPMPPISTIVQFQCAKRIIIILRFIGIPSEISKLFNEVINPSGSVSILLKPNNNVTYDDGINKIIIIVLVNEDTNSHSSIFFEFNIHSVQNIFGQNVLPNIVKLGKLY